MSQKTSKKIKKDKSLVIDINNRFKFTEKQKNLAEIISSKDVKIIFVNGPAGTSKTYMAVYSALKMYYEGKIETIKYVRSVVQSGKKDFGILPGGINEKMDPFMDPLVDKLSEFISSDALEELTKFERIEAIPVNFARGHNWENDFIIVDEAQNFDKDELLTVISRIAEGSKMVICGDTMQADIRKSGFKRFMDMFSDEKSVQNGIVTFSFGHEDIVRSKILRFITERVEYEFARDKREDKANDTRDKPNSGGYSDLSAPF